MIVLVAVLTGVGLAVAGLLREIRDELKAIRLMMWADQMRRKGH